MPYYGALYVMDKEQQAIEPQALKGKSSCVNIHFFSKTHSNSPNSTATLLDQIKTFSISSSAAMATQEPCFTT